mgnify:CR=1 FL=1
MLKSLTIENYALIDSLHVEWDEHLNIITGETGAGKSIIMGALALVMGARADSKSVREGAQKCVVEATFQITDYRLQSIDNRLQITDNFSTLNSQLSTIFEEYGLDFEEECVIRREVTAAGKSRAFVNDTPVTLQQMRAIASLLIDIHSQHENLLLNDSNFQLKIVDIKQVFMQANIGGKINYMLQNY